MRVDVSQLIEHLGETQEVEMPYELELDGEDYTVVSPVQLHLTLLSIGDEGILVQGSVSGEVSVKCARCLKPFIEGFSVTVEEEYKRISKLMTVTAADKELGAEDFVYTIDSDGHIDLTEVVRQNIIVNLPLKYICQKNCNGIEWDHPKESLGDPRFAKLKDLKGKAKK